MTRVRLILYSVFRAVSILIKKYLLDEKMIDVEEYHAKAGLSAEEWVKMWESGEISEDHTHDETHQTSCGDSESCSHGHEDNHIPFLERNLHHLTNDNTDKSIFVSLCGNSPDMEWLCNKGYSVVGAEISERAVKEAFDKGHVPFEVNTDGNIKVYSATDSKKFKVYVGNFFSEEIVPGKLGTFDCIWDGHGIVAIPVSQQSDYAKKLLTFLKPGGKILFSTVDYDTTKLKSGPAPASVPASRIQELYPQCEVNLIEEKPLPAGELEGINEWSNLMILVTSI